MNFEMVNRLNSLIHKYNIPYGISELVFAIIHSLNIKACIELTQCNLPIILSKLCSFRTMEGCIPISIANYVRNSITKEWFSVNRYSKTYFHFTSFNITIGPLGICTILKRVWNLQIYNLIYLFQCTGWCFVKTILYLEDKCENEIVILHPNRHLWF